MSSTFTPIQAFDYAKRFIKQMPLEQVQTQILDDTQKMMWMHSPWRWTIGTFPNIVLVNDTQDYTVAVPADFLYIQESYIGDSLGSAPRLLHIEPFIVPGGKKGSPSRLALTSGTAGANGNIRFSPVPGQVPANGWTSFTLYKKQAPTVTAANANTPGLLVFDDEWYWVYVSGLLYFAYLYGDDQRAGSAQVDPSSGKVSFTGQRGTFEANLALMKQREKLPGMDSTVTPEQKEQN
jgi:hypothetical protein